jgi:HSP20 family protein
MEKGSNMRQDPLEIIFNRFFNRHFDTMEGGLALGRTIPAVNIIETINYLLVEVAAPGFIRDDFEINLANDILTIFAENKAEQHTKCKINRREYSYTTFERSFKIYNPIVYEKAQTDYKNGVFTINIPKTDGIKHNTTKPTLDE